MSETRPHDQPDEATVDLLVKQVTEGLSPAEHTYARCDGRRRGGHLSA